ncbi:MAG TPA: hypothetical protein DCG12_07525, partial [Planctomycetaceae bacterium]|nr:hypothetical protein [Planctomycetaceae bacterium]
WQILPQSCAAPGKGARLRAVPTIGIVWRLTFQVASGMWPQGLRNPFDRFLRQNRNIFTSCTAGPIDTQKVQHRKDWSQFDGYSITDLRVWSRQGRRQ